MSSNNNRHDISSQPKFSAFAIMILILLAIFSFISKINLLIDKTDNHIYSISEKSSLSEMRLNDSRKRLVTTYKSQANNSEPAKSDREIVVSNIPAPKNIVNNSSIASETSIAKETASKSNQGNEIANQSETNAEEDYLPSYPIVPQRPQKGDRLGTVFAEKSDYIPAEKNVISPASKPKELISYKAAIPSDRLEVKQFRTHILAKDETLWAISARYLGKGTLWKDIIKANPGLNPDSLIPGTKIRIPLKKVDNSLKLSMIDSEE